jgi:hypothetical protein
MGRPILLPPSLSSLVASLLGYVYTIVLSALLLLLLLLHGRAERRACVRAFRRRKRVSGSVTGACTIAAGRGGGGRGQPGRRRHQPPIRPPVPAQIDLCCLTAAAVAATLRRGKHCLLGLRDYMLACPKAQQSDIEVGLQFPNFKRMSALQTHSNTDCAYCSPCTRIAQYEIGARVTGRKQREYSLGRKCSSNKKTYFMVVVAHVRLKRH